jgi:hypothetical protein
VAEHAGYHESIDALSPATIERHRAIVSLIEELEAIDWYAQRVDACTDDALAAVLAHNRDEEREHAAMTLEWLRRNDPTWDRILRIYLFSTGPITEVEAAAEGDEPEGSGESDLGVGDLRGARETS